MYAKIKNGELVSAPRFLWRKNGLPIMNPTEDDYLNAGYRLFVPSEMPNAEDGYYAVCDFEQTEKELIQIWRVLKDMRPMLESEVNRMLIAQQINTLSVDDNTALRMKEFYPEWAVGIAYEAGFKFQHNGKLWRVLQSHTSQDGWQPENAASLFEQINETHSGTKDDPVPYNGNMALTSGLYYMQDYIIYLCNRDTGNPVYNPLSELVGLYIEEV